MATYQTELRVRYAETDQGGVVYNSNYLIFFEVGRTEMMRELGVPYARLEAEGTILPVVEAHVSYRAPAVYDDRLTIVSRISELRRVRLKIETQVIHAESGRLLAEGWVWLAAIDSQGNVKRLPVEVENAVSL
ncbi:MAG: acyl-CoA thioester hydrolase [Planctomycetota bacterium]